MAMLQLSKPRKGKETRYTWENALERFVELCVYCADDVLAERDLDHQLPDLSRRERRVWELDQAINDRGVAVDLVAIDNARALIDEYKLRLAFQCELETGFAPTQRDKIAEWVRGNGYPQLPDLQKETVAQAVHDPRCPIDVADILKLYSTYNAKAVTKYDTIVDAVCSDGRLRGMFLYHGAGTGRWASRIVQLQNLFRPVIEDCDTAIEAMVYRDLDWLIDLYPETDPLKVLASCIRGMLVPGEGKVLQSLDYAAIESRVNAWLWGEEWKLKAFREFDAGTGPDLYKLAYARAFRKAEPEVTKHERQLGKVMELACLGAETLVLTDSGTKRIIDVTLNDKLWDGAEWVTHAGLVDRGVRPVVPVAGIELTPDHLVLVGRTWTPAQAIALNESILRRALATGSENLPSSALSARNEGRVTSISSAFSARAGQSRTLCSTTTSEKERALDAPFAPESNRRAGERAIGLTPMSSPTTRTGGDCSTAFLRASTDARTRMTPGTATTAGEASGCSRLGGKIVGLFCSIWSRFQGGMSLRSSLTEPTSTAVTSREISASSQSGRTTETAAKFTNCSPKSSSYKPVFDIAHAGPRNRFTVMSNQGPLVVHNCGYEGGVGAFVTMVTTYGIDLDAMASEVRQVLPADVVDSAQWLWERNGARSEVSQDVFIACDGVKQLWRRSHPKITAGWKALKEAAVLAVQNKGTVYSVAQNKLAFKCDGRFLKMRLPSGRCLHYLDPETDGESFSYMGVDTDTRRWMRTKSYGGKLDENSVQAISRDLLVNGMFELEAGGYPLIMTVHDEAVSEIEPTKSLEEAQELFCRAPEWAAGLPLVSEGWHARRYKK
jgi:hypothetical protein